MGGRDEVGLDIGVDRGADKQEDDRGGDDREFNTTFLGIKRREASGLFFVSNIILIFVLIIAN